MPGDEQVAVGSPTTDIGASVTASTTSSNGMPTASSFAMVVPRSQTGLLEAAQVQVGRDRLRQQPARDRDLGDPERVGGAAVADVEDDAARGAALGQRE